MSLFSRKKPAKIVSKAVSALEAYHHDSKNDNALRIINKNFTRMTEILYKKKEGDETSQKALQLVSEISNTQFISIGLDCMLQLPVEERKQFTNIFTGSITHKNANEYPIVKWILKNRDVLNTLIGFYEYPELAISAGEMLRLCAKHSEIANEILTKEKIVKLFSFFTVPHFDVSSDSFATFRELILTPVSDHFLKENSQMIIEELNKTLDDSNYTACRQSLKLIGEILSHHQNFQKIYLTDEHNLIVIMKLMSSSYHNISLEALKLFILFVENNNKPEPIIRILNANNKKLIEFVNGLLEERIEEQSINTTKLNDLLSNLSKL